MPPPMQVLYRGICFVCDRSAHPLAERSMAMQRERITLPISNLGCGGALAVEQALTQVSGVAQAYVNPLTEMAYIVYDPALANAEQLRDVIERMGYGAPLSEARQKRQPTSAAPVATRRQVHHLAIRAGM